MSVAASKLLKFPNPVNEYAARSVAAMVVLLCTATLVFQTPWLLWLLALGFLARVASGPRFSLFGQLATRVIDPRIGPAKLVPGPPKRFAQAIGATLSVGGAGRLLPGSSDAVLGASRPDHRCRGARVGLRYLAWLHHLRPTAGDWADPSLRVRGMQQYPTAHRCRGLTDSPTRRIDLRSNPVAGSNTNPRTELVSGMNGLGLDPADRPADVGVRRLTDGQRADLVVDETPPEFTVSRSGRRMRRGRTPRRRSTGRLMRWDRAPSG